MVLGQQIRKWMHFFGIDEQELCNRMSLSTGRCQKKLVNNHLNDRNEPRRSTIELFASAFGVLPDRFGQPPPPKFETDSIEVTHFLTHGTAQARAAIDQVHIFQNPIVDIGDVFPDAISCLDLISNERTGLSLHQISDVFEVSQHLAIGQLLAVSAQLNLEPKHLPIPKSTKRELVAIARKLQWKPSSGYSIFEYVDILEKNNEDALVFQARDLAASEMVRWLTELDKNYRLEIADHIRVCDSKIYTNLANNNLENATRFHLLLHEKLLPPESKTKFKLSALESVLTQVTDSLSVDTSNSVHSFGYDLMSSNHDRIACLLVQSDVDAGLLTDVLLDEHILGRSLALKRLYRARNHLT